MLREKQKRSFSYNNKKIKNNMATDNETSLFKNFYKAVFLLLIVFKQKSI